MNDTLIVTALAQRLLRFLESRDHRHALIVGEAGSGKTTLLHYLAEELKKNGSIAAIVSAVPYSSVDELVASIARALDVDESLFPPDVREYQATLRLRPMLEHVRKVVDQSKSVFLFIDDIDQFSESSSVTALLESLVTNTGHLARVVLASRRGTVSAPLQRNRSLEVFELPGLSLHEAATWLRAKIDRPISTENLAALVRLANGNPLILEVLASTVGRLSAEDLEVLSSSAQPNSVVLDSLLERALRLEDQSADVKRVLAALSVLKVATVEQLTKGTGLAPDVVNDAIRTLASQGLIVLDRGAAEFALLAIRERAVKALVLEAEVDPTQLSFGDEAAERDALLPDHFVPPPDLNQIMDGVMTIVLGDRGSGKSAVFRSLGGFRTDGSPMVQRATRPDVIVAVSKDPAAFMQRFTTDDAGVLSADRFKALWLFFASALAAREVHPHAGDSPDAKRYSREAWRLLRQVGWADAIHGEGRLRRVWAKVRALLPQQIAFMAGPVTIKPEWSKRETRSGQRNAMEIGEFIKKTESILIERQRRLLIVVDQIDELYTYDRKTQEAMVQGLFMAETYLSQTQMIRFIVLLRTDLFAVYDIQEKNKFVSRTVSLKWTWPDLILQMLRRAFANAVLSATAARLTDSGVTAATSELHLRLLFPENIEGVPLIEWLRGSLQNGRSAIAPRQIILFLNFLKSNARQPRNTVPIFSETEVLGAIHNLSESAFNEVVTDFRVAVAFVRNCRAAKLSVFKLGDVEHLSSPDEGTIAVQVELLERLGFLAREVVEEQGKPVARFRIPTLFTRCWQ